MSEQNKQQVGDGSDNYGQAAKQMANAAKKAGNTVGKQAAAKGAEATANAAASTVQAGMKTGKAVSKIAAGTAAGGPWGAILSAAWSMRHTLFKILITICIVIVLICVVVVSLPKIIFDWIFGVDQTEPLNPTSAYVDLSDGISTVIEDGYEFALSEVERLITESGYDYDFCMSYVVDNAKDTREYDVCYILAAYSVSMGREKTSKSDMVSKLKGVEKKMFTVTSEKKESERPSSDDPSITEVVEYLECTVHPFDQDVIFSAFGIDLDAEYEAYGMSNKDAIEYMANVLRATLFGNGKLMQRGLVLEYGTGG